MYSRVLPKSLACVGIRNFSLIFFFLRQGRDAVIGQKVVGQWECLQMHLVRARKRGGVDKEDRDW